MLTTRFFLSPLPPLPFLPLLKQIIADKKKGGPKKRTARRSGTGAHAAKAKLVGRGGLPAATAAKRRASAPGATDTPASSSATMAVKIIISNLPTDVNEAQIKVCKI
jgi:THO complex subunit 4